MMKYKFTHNDTDIEIESYFDLIDYICSNWSIQPFQILFRDGKVILTDKLGTIFADVGNISYGYTE